MNALKINPFQWCLTLFGGISFINALDESFHEVFRQLQRPCRSTLYKSLLSSYSKASCKIAVPKISKTIATWLKV